MTQDSPGAASHDEPHSGGMATRLNWLRAAVLGANDGIVSTAPVSSQRDSERAMLALERRELAEAPQAEVTELARIYQAKGLAPPLEPPASDRAFATAGLPAG